MNINRGIHGVKRFAVPSLLVGVLTLVVVLYCVAISADGESEGMKSIARMAVIGGAIAQAVLVVALLLPGTQPLQTRGGGDGVMDQETKRNIQKRAPELFIWFAVGEVGGLLVFLCALLGLFIFGFLPSGMVTLAIVIGGFMVYAACFVIRIILPLAHVTAATKSD